MGLYVKTKIDGLDKLKKHIEFVKKMALLKTNKDFQEYIQNKFLETVNRISMERLPVGSMSLEYISHNQIRQLDDGFILYNDTTIETDTEGYGGQFSIALAFEYGTGIVGQEHPKKDAWEYNVKQHTGAWIYYQDGSFHITKGFEGYEIYRFTLEEIKSKLKDWVEEYRVGGVSK